MTDKGLLAFAVRMDGAELAELVRSYMRANPGRRAQFDALVRCLHANSSPEALQVLLSIARRHTMAGVRSTAAALARDAAEGRGWSAEGLADRTIPAAGFDDDGLLRLSYGRPGQPRPQVDLQVALDDVAALTGVRIEPEAVIDHMLVRWDGTLPPVTPAYRERTTRLEEQLAPVTGLEVTGAWVAGTGIAAVVEHARDAVGRLMGSHGG